MQTPSTRFVRRIGLPLLGALAALVAASCGNEPSGETVYLYVVNGYSGTSSLSLYGPTGPIVENLGFGDRNGSAPIEIDRNLGTDFKVVLDGAPLPFDLSKDLFAMYPQETGTLFIKRRSGEEGLESALFRHVQTITDSCAVTFTNALDLGSDYLTGGKFSFAPEWEMEPGVAGYSDEKDVPVLTECGEMPTPNPSAILRDDLHEAIAARPYFFFAECQTPSLAGGLCAVWGELDLQEQIVGPANTRDYLDCVAGAIAFDKNALGGTQCPDTLSWSDLEVDQEAVNRCKDPRRVAAEMARPEGEEEGVTLVDKELPEAFDLCNATFRLRTPGLDVIFGPDGEGVGEHQDGGLVETTLEVPAGSEHFYVLFGRPVNPLVWQWDSGENFADLTDHPYFNDQDEKIGDYDD